MGDDAGFLNAARIKGSHAAIKTGVLAAEATFEAVQAGRQSDELTAYLQAFKKSWLHEELHKACNFKQCMSKGVYLGTLMVGIEQKLFGGKVHGITVRNDAPGTADSKLIVSIEEVTPTCTPEGANGHVRARLKGSIDFEDGTHDDYILRDFVKNPENYKSPDRAGPVIGPRIPRRITLAIEGECGPEQHAPLYPGEQPT